MSHVTGCYYVINLGYGPTARRRLVALPWHISPSRCQLHTSGWTTSIGVDQEHPVPFLEDIVTVPILQTADQGDLAVDPFMGTGTTGKVANEHGRRFIGYDIQTY